MGTISRILGSLLASVIGIAVMVAVATVVFYVTVFVVTTGASLAGLEPDDNFLVLSASLVVVAIILTGGLSPGLSSGPEEDEEQPSETDPAYN